MSRPPREIDLSREQIIIKPDSKLPKFHPPPKAVMIVPLYNIDQDLEDRMYGSRSPDHGRSSRSYRHPPEGGRAVYTDSEYDDSGPSPFIPYIAGSAYGGEKDDSHTYRDDDDDSYQGSQAQADFRYMESQASEHGRYPESDLSQHHQATSSQYRGTHRLAASPQRKLQKHQSGSFLRGRSSQSTLRHPDRTGSISSERPDIRHFLADVQRYLEILPMHPDFRYSRCTGRKKAVCIGINYVGQKDELKGCANDARNMRKFIMAHYGFQSQDILLLVDDGQSNSSLRPTRKEMFNAMAWLVKDAQKHDSLFFHYSGHGGQTPDNTGKEADGMDEVIFPVDFTTTQDIIDDELHKALVDPLPPGCRLTAIFDSCHSGTVLDLPYLHSAHGRLRGISHISRRVQQCRVAPCPDVISFAACKDDETSADTFSGGVATGAMSHEFIRSMEQNPNQTYEELLQDLRDNLIPKYHQKAQISGTHPLDLERQFIL